MNSQHPKPIRAQPEFPLPQRSFGQKKKLLLKEECGPAGIRWGGEGPSGGQGQDLEPCTGSEEPQTLSSSKYCSPLNQPPFAELSLGQTLGSAERAEGKAKVPVPRELTMVKE